MPLPLRIVAVFVFNTLIGVFLTVIGYGDTLTINVISSQCMGFSIFTVTTLSGKLRIRPALLVVPLAVTIGAVLGTGLAVVVTGLLRQDRLQWPPDVILQVVLIGLLFGAVATWFFRQRETLADVHEALQQSRMQRLVADREQANMQLRLLQAQIEPHFLFNTLANVDSLLGSDPERGRYMLRRFTDYLRRSLQHSRQKEVTLGEELAVIRTYVDIMAMRMGNERLQWRESLAPDAETTRLAPMLLQPLVENAIRHGLEPRAGGGVVEVAARRDGGFLVVQVLDNGAGFSGATPGAGMGLANVRERLGALYGDSASLVLEERPEGGVCVGMYLPLATGAETKQ